MCKNVLFLRRTRALNTYLLSTQMWRRDKTPKEIESTLEVFISTETVQVCRINLKDIHTVASQ